MAQRPRRPGDQAPPNTRPAHRNEHIRTATTHVKDTAGKLYRVHDGRGTTLVLDGSELVNLPYDQARKAKDACVTKLKCRTASVQEVVYATPDSPAPVAADSFVPADKPNPDPVLERQRQAAVAAVKPVAQQAQARASAVPQQQRAPGWTPPEKRAQPTGRAPGWEPPPDGASGAKKAAAANDQQGRAAGWERQDKIKHAPEASAVVGLDLPDVGDGDEAGANDPDVADLLVSSDLETDVKDETERANAAAKKLWEGTPPEKQAQLKAQIIRVATDGERDKLYAHLDEKQVEEFEAYETAYHLLFGLPPQKPAAAPEAAQP